MQRLLCPERGMPIVPTIPCIQDRDLRRFNAVLSKEGRGGLSYLYVMGTRDLGKSMVRVYVLQDDIWCKHTSATCQLHIMHCKPKDMLVNNKICMPDGNNVDIIVFDLTAWIVSTIQLPQGVMYNYFITILSLTDDASGLYFIHVNGFQLLIWLHVGDNWFLVDTVWLRMLDHMLKDEHSANVQQRSRV